MAAHLLSLNLGRAEPSTAKNVGVTGIAKRPVALAHLRAPGPKQGGMGSGLEGDFLGDTRHHGGDHQAVYAFAREELDWWAEQLGRALPSGMFGENVTTRGLDVDGALVGERWAVGEEVLLEVCGPRIPCATFAARMGERGWVRRFSKVGRTGAYLSIVSGGTVRAGDPIEVVRTPDHDITVPDTFRAFLGDLDVADRVLASGCLAEVEAAELRDTVSRRRASGSELDG